MKREHTGAYQWHFYYPFNDFTSSVFIFPPSPSLLFFSHLRILLYPSPISRQYLHAFNLQKRTLRKNRHELSLRLARNLMRSHRRSRASRYHSRPMILHCASRVSNTCSKQSARGSFMHRGKIKRLSLSLGRPPFSLAPSGTRFAIDYINLLLNLYQECPHVVRITRLKESSRATAPVFSPFSRLP